MNSMEEAVRQTLAERALDIPEGSAPSTPIKDGKPSTHDTKHRWRWVAPLSVAAMTAAVVFGVVAVSEWQEGRGRGETASGSGVDLTGVLFAAFDGHQPRLYSTDGAGRSSRTSSSDMPMYSADWSPDGSQIAFIGTSGGEGDLYVMNADGSNIDRVLQTPDLDEGDATWSADGSSIYFWQSDEDGKWLVKNIGLASGSVTTVPHTDNAGGIAVSPDGEHLAIVRNTGGPVSIFILSTADGSVIEELPGISSHPAWSPDGRRLAYGDSEGHLVLRDIASGTIETLDIPGGLPLINGVAWGPDENYVIVQTDRRADPSFGVGDADDDLNAAPLFVVDLSSGTFESLDIGGAEVFGGVAWGTPALPVTEVPDIRGLLGKDVGDALGLTPAPEDTNGCYAFAEYDNPWGFCYDEVVAGDEAYHLLGRQINGHAPTEAGANYLAAAIELKAMMKGTIEYNAEREAVLLATLAEYEGDLSEGR